MKNKYLRGAAISIMDFCLFGAMLALSPIVYLIRQIAPKKKISVWTGAPIINLAINSKAEKLLGVSSFSVVSEVYFITDQFDFVLSRFANSKIVTFILRYLSCFFICIIADRVHAYADGGILPQKIPRCFNKVEIFLYNFFGLDVFIWTYGADVRTRSKTISLGRENCCVDCKQVGKACVCSDSIFHSNYMMLLKKSKAVFSMGDMTEYTPGSRNDLYFWPVNLYEYKDRYEPCYPSTCSSRPLKVVHAPNHRWFKGTKYLEFAVDKLIKEGVEVELILVEGLSNSKALEIYKTADVIFDQCLAGFHGYFLLEAMALGKPVMTYIRKPDSYLLNSEQCPIINVTASSIEEKLRYFACEGRAELSAIGKESRVYIEQNFTMKSFSDRLERAYRDLGVIK